MPSGSGSAALKGGVRAPGGSISGDRGKPTSSHFNVDLAPGTLRDQAPAGAAARECECVIPPSPRRICLPLPQFVGNEDTSWAVSYDGTVTKSCPAASPG